MKKLIVLSVIFALLAGSVFAADISVDVHGGATLASSSNKEYLDDVTNTGEPVFVTDRVGTGFGISRARIGASGETEDGAFGGWARLDFSGDAGGAGFAWWKPVDQVKLQIGANPDGEWGLDGVTRWGFLQTAGDVGVAKEHWGFGSSFFGGYGGKGLILNITPAEGIAINIGIPLVNTKYGEDGKVKYDPNTGKAAKDGDLFKFGDDGNYAYQNYKQFTLQAKYDIAGVGTAGITYENSLFVHAKDVKKTPAGAWIAVYDDDMTTWQIGKKKNNTEEILGPNNDNPKLWAFFGLTSIENLGIDVGIGYQFSDTFYDNETLYPSSTATETTYTINNPVAAGVGVNFSSGALGVKARVQGKFGGSKVTDIKITLPGDKSISITDTLGTGLDMIIDVQPSYAINDTLTAYLSTGVGFTTGEEYVEKRDDDGKATIAAETRSLVNWYVNPYIVIKGAFFAGIRLDSPKDYYYTFNKEGDATRNRIVNFSIPIGIAVSF
jgi:hypothetical protein